MYVICFSELKETNTYTFEDCFYIWKKRAYLKLIRNNFQRQFKIAETNNKVEVSEKLETN